MRAGLRGLIDATARAVIARRLQLGYSRLGYKRYRLSPPPFLRLQVGQGRQAGALWVHGFYTVKSGALYKPRSWFFHEGSWFYTVKAGRGFMAYRCYGLGQPGTDSEPGLCFTCL